MRLRSILTPLVLAWLLAACGGGSGAAPGATTRLPTGSADETAEPDQTDAADATIPVATDGPTAGTGSGSGDATGVGTGRPVSVTATLSSSNWQIDGAYSATGSARACGQQFIAITGREFQLQFPRDLTPTQVSDVTFFASDLAGGTSTTAFSLSVSVMPRPDYSPPKSFYDTNPEAASGDSGTAKRSEAGGITTLTVDVTASTGEHLNLTATCGPA
jgi:hypothetical protein